MTTSPARPLKTPFTELVGVRFPIVQTGMGWVSGARLTAATAAAGGFGILASATMTIEQLAEAVDKVRQRTDNPFGVNLRGDQPDIDRYIAFLIEHKIRLASFASPPPRDVIDRLKAADILVMPTVGAPRHAEKMQEWGVDAVIAQGHEGGGHTGPIATTLLLPAVARAVDIPVIGAGGFNSGQGLVAALAWGAAGIAMGTRFLLTQESHVPEHVKQVYLQTGLRDTIVTTVVDGHPQRVIRTPLIDKLEHAGPIRRLWLAFRNALAMRKVTGNSFWALLREGLAMRKNQGLTWAQVTMAANAPMLTRATVVEGRVDAGILPTGQVTGAIGDIPTVAELLDRIMNEAHQTLDRLSALRAASDTSSESTMEAQA
ncbi:MAG: nitronate monooxygenase [Candidatus Dadabacteria bacterium]|nr:MAG: nitronate monooxygenase [Candidatus Dadabacteria bacterium]